MVSYFYSWQNIVLAGDDNNDYFQSVEGGVCRGVEAWLFVFPWLRLNSNYDRILFCFSFMFFFLFEIIYNTLFLFDLNDAMTHLWCDVHVWRESEASSES